MMNKLMRIAAAVIIVTSALAACTGGNDALKLAKKLDAEFTNSVPVGSSKADVIAFLKAYNIEYHDEPSLKVVTASIRDVQRSIVTKFGVYMKFVFDDAGRLQSHDIRALGTGP